MRGEHHSGFTRPYRQPRPARQVEYRGWLGYLAGRIFVEVECGLCGDQDVVALVSDPAPLVAPATLDPAAAQEVSKGRLGQLLVGMVVSAEIKTEGRLMMDYFLNQLLKLSE